MADQTKFVAYLNGSIVPYAEALAAVGQGESQSTLGLYDAERTFSGIVLKLRAHLQRLYRSL